MMTLTATVALGTLYPVIIEAITGFGMSVGAPYFDQTFNPIALMTLMLAAYAPFLPWAKRAKRSTFYPHMVMIGISILCTWGLHLLVSFDAWLAWCAVTISLWIILSMGYLLYQKTCRPWQGVAYLKQKLRQQHRGFYAMISAHCGVAIMVLGITGATSLDEEFIVTVDTQSTEHQLNHDWSTKISPAYHDIAKNYVTKKRTVELFYQDILVAQLEPEQRYYPVEDQRTSESSIMSSMIRDIYATSGFTAQEGVDVVTIRMKPLMNMIWLGAVFMALGVFMAISWRWRP